MGPFDMLVRIQQQRLKCESEEKMWPRTHQQEQWRRSCFGFGPREPPRGLRLGQLSTAQGTRWSRGRQEDWQQGACQLMPGIQKSYPSVKQDRPCCLSLWRKLEREGPVRGSGQAQGGAYQGKLGKMSCRGDDPLPSWPNTHRSDTDPEGELAADPEDAS